MSLDVILGEVHEKIEGIVRHREKLEGSMVKGYIVYESFYYANEYINKINDTQEEMVWDDQQDEEKMEEDLLQMNRKKHA